MAAMAQQRAAAQQQHQQQEENVEELENNLTSYRKIEELENYSVSKVDIIKLKAGGYNTIESIAHGSMRKLQEVKGITEAKAQKIKEIIKTNQLVPIGFQTASNRLECMKDIIMISTGSNDLDVLLGGGIETGSITEIFGEFRTGKTQICHTLCVTAQRPLDQGGAEGRVIYVDTEGCFRPQKLVAIAERFQMNPEEVLDNIICARAHNSEQQLELLADAAALMSDSRYR
jgi:DNA repair protein RAD51